MPEIESPSPSFVRKLQEYDSAAWREVFDRLYSVALRGAEQANPYLSAEDKEEVASDALAHVTQQIGGLETWQQVTAMTFVIAQRRSIDRLRRMRALKRYATESRHLPLEQIAPDDLPAIEPRALAKWAELSEVVARLVDGLGEPATALVRGYVEEGLTYEELARRANLPLGTVVAQVYRSMRRLEREIGRTSKLAKELSLYLRLLV